MATTRKPPAVPIPQAPIVDADGRPSREFYQWLTALIAWAKQADAELT